VPLLAASDQVPYPPTSDRSGSSIKTILRKEHRYHGPGLRPVRYVVELVDEALEMPDATEETTDYSVR
jgi:hypothetical protein